MSLAASPAAFSITDAAKHLGVSRGTLYGLIRSGELRPTKIGALTLILQLDINALLARLARDRSAKTLHNSPRMRKLAARRVSVASPQAAAQEVAGQPMEAFA